MANWPQLAQGLQTGLQPAIQSKLAEKQNARDLAERLKYLKKLSDMQFAQKQLQEKMQYRDRFNRTLAALKGVPLQGATPETVARLSAAGLPINRYFQPTKQESELLNLRKLALEEQNAAQKAKGDYWSQRGKTTSTGPQWRPGEYQLRKSEEQRKQELEQAQRDIKELNSLATEYKKLMTGFETVGGKQYAYPQDPKRAKQIENRMIELSKKLNRAFIPMQPTLPEPPTYPKVPISLKTVIPNILWESGAEKQADRDYEQQYMSYLAKLKDFAKAGNKEAIGRLKALDNDTIKMLGERVDSGDPEALDIVNVLNEIYGYNGQ